MAGVRSIMVKRMWGILLAVIAAVGSSLFIAEDAAYADDTPAVVTTADSEGGNAGGAVEIWGGESIVAPDSADGSTKATINVLGFKGDTGHTVFLTVRNGDQIVSKNVAYTVGDAADGDSESDSAAAFTITMPLEKSKLDNGSYQVDVYASRDDDAKPVCTGIVYGVWGQLEGVSGEKLIGTRTIVNGEAPAFSAPSTIYFGNNAYELASEEPQGGESAPAYSYSKASESDGAADGIVKFIDKSGNVLTTEKITKIPHGGSKTYNVPQAIDADGKTYRTMSLVSSFEARNPGNISFVVPCALLSDADSAAAGHYVAAVRMVAGSSDDGVVIVSDSVNVTGPYLYTAPDTIYKTHVDADGVRQVYTYVLKDDATVTLKPEEASPRLVTFHYDLQEPDELGVEVTFNLINGQERARSGNTNRQLLAPKKVMVNDQNKTAMPDQQIVVEGTVYNLAGSPQDYAYEYGSGDIPVINAYYVPDGYEAPGPYQVTVRYVDYVSNQLITSETVMSSPDSTEDLLITPPEQFEESGVTYVRLPGQEEPIAHNYYSNISTYVVYYHDKNVKLENDVVETVRVVYVEGPTTTTTTTATTTTTTTGTATGTAARSGAAATAGTDAAGAAGTTGTATGQLNQNNPYNAVGENNDTLTNQGGVDPNQERIEDNETALSSGLDQEADDGAKGSQPGLAPWVVLAIVVLLAVVAGGVVFVVARNRSYNVGGPNGRGPRM